MSHSLWLLFVLVFALVPPSACLTPSQHVRSVVHSTRHAQAEASASASASASAPVQLSFQDKPTITFHTLQTGNDTTPTPTVTTSPPGTSLSTVTPAPTVAPTQFPPINSSGIPNPPPETTRNNIISGDIYTNSTGVRLYFPDMMRVAHDFKTPFSSTILEMYQTDWNDNSIVVLSSTVDLLLRQQYIRLYLAFRNGTRREILRDFWADTSHPWYLGQTIGFNREASPSKIILTFEGRVSGEDPNQFMALGFHVMDLAVSPDRLFPWRVNQTKPGDLVEIFRIIEKPEPTYYRDGTVANATFILRSRDTLVSSQVSPFQNYQLIPLEPIGSPSVEQGFLLLVRCKWYGGVRLIKYTDKMVPIFQTLLVPEIVNPIDKEFLNLPSTVGHVKVDPDGHIYILVDITDHELEAVSNYHRAVLSQRNQQTSILFILHEDGSIIRADWVPISYPMMSGQITTAITVQQGDGRIAIIHVGITTEKQIASVIEYLDYDIAVTPPPTPRSRAALIHTLPPSIRDTCVIASRQVTVYTVTALTDGKYALAGTHGYVQDVENARNPFPTAPGTAFVATVDLEKLLTDNTTSLRVHNFAVLKRDNIATHVIATSTGYLVGAVIDRSLRNEPQQQLRYQRTAIFQGTLTTENRLCAPVNGTGGWVTCGREMCLSWCSTMTPSSIDTSINIAQDATCAAIKDNLSGPTSVPSDSSDSPSRAVKLGVGLGIGLVGGLLLLCGLAYCLKKRATETNTCQANMDGVGPRTSSIPHQPLREDPEGM